MINKGMMLKTFQILLEKLGEKLITKFSAVISALADIRLEDFKEVKNVNDVEEEISNDREILENEKTVNYKIFITSGRFVIGQMGGGYEKKCVFNRMGVGKN